MSYLWTHRIANFAIKKSIFFNDLIVELEMVTMLQLVETLNSSCDKNRELLFLSHQPIGLQ